MTIRSGRGPRDPFDPNDPARPPEMPTWRASDGHGNPPPIRPRLRRDEAPRSRVPGVVRFLLFSGLLAVVVLVALFTALRPLARAAVTSWAWDNPTALKLPFVADLVREDLGAVLTDPNGGLSGESVFEVVPGDTLASLASRLKDGGYIADERAFIFTAIQDELAPKLKAGSFVLRGDMTLEQVIDAVVSARLTITSVDVTFREGLRLEQATALLSTIASGVDAAEYYALAKNPPASLVADFPWLAAAGLPEGASLEGFLYPATYTLVTGSNGGPIQVTNAESLIRSQLKKFIAEVGEARMVVPADRKLTFYQILSLASIVQHETPVQAEKPLVAGVYQNRLDKLKGFIPLLGSEPTVIYAVDTMNLRKLDLSEWKTYFFWDSIKTLIRDVKVTKDLQGYQTYQVVGLIPGPISSPATIDIDAALHPDQTAGFLYFLALPDKTANVFAKTLAEQNANIKKYYG